MTSNHISLKCHRFPHKSFTHGPCQKIIVQKFAAVAVQQLPKTILGRSRPGGALGPTKNRGRDGNTLERHLGGSEVSRIFQVVQKDHFILRRLMIFHVLSAWSRKESPWVTYAIMGRLGGLVQPKFGNYICLPTGAKKVAQLRQVNFPILSHGTWPYMARKKNRKAVSRQPPSVDNCVFKMFKSHWSCSIPMLGPFVPSSLMLAAFQGVGRLRQKACRQMLHEKLLLNHPKSTKKSMNPIA